MAGSSIFSRLTLVLLFSSLVLASAVDSEYGPKPEEKSTPLPPYSDKNQLPDQGLHVNQPKYGEEEAKPEGQQYHHNIPTNLLEYSYGHHGHHDQINNIGIQGLILCKYGPKDLPLAGALARITCLAEDESGYEAAPFYTESHGTTENGFFLATFSLSDVIGTGKLKLKECKAFLEDSPLETCNVPTDVNNGITGAILSSSRFLPEKLMTLYTVGPFIYTSDPNSVPANDHSGPDGHY